MPFFPPRGGSSSVVQLPFAVEQFGAVGNGIANDTVAIQACIDAAYAASKYSGFYDVYFQQNGKYKITSSLTIPGGGRFWGGSSGCQIIGTFADFLMRDIDTPTAGYSTAADVFENISFVNNGHGGGIRFSAGKSDCFIKSCYFSTDGDAVTHQTATFNGVFMPTIIGCTFVSTAYGRANGSAAIRLNATGLSSIGNYMQGWAFGHVLAGQGHSVTGGRTESCDVAYLLGQDPAGDLVTLEGFNINSHWMEANNVSFDGRSVSNFGIDHILGGQWGEVQPPDQDPRYGILLRSASYGKITNVTPGGSFSKAAIQFDSGVSNISLENVHAANTNAAGAVWSIASLPSEIKCVNCNYTPTTGVEVPDMQYDSQATRGLSTLDYLNPTVLSKNLGGSVSVGSAATSVAVLFPAALDATANQITSLTQGTGGSLTLLAPYHYQVALVTPTGEVVGSSLSATTLTGSNNKITVNLSNVTATYSGYAFAKRLYRGTGLTGEYQGYWDLAGSASSFVDTGSVAFDGIKQPTGNSATSISAAESDAAYGVVVTPGWATDWYITDLATTGFTINFSSAPGSDTSVKWMIYR